MYIRKEEEDSMVHLWSAEVWQMGGLTGCVMDWGSKMNSLILLSSKEQWWIEVCQYGWEMNGRRWKGGVMSIKVLFISIH